MEFGHIYHTYQSVNTNTDTNTSVKTITSISITITTIYEAAMCPALTRRFTNILHIFTVHLLHARHHSWTGDMFMNRRQNDAYPHGVYILVEDRKLQA